MSANGQRPGRKQPGGRSCLVLLAVAAAALAGALAPASAQARPAYDYTFNWQANWDVGGWVQVAWRTDNHGDGAIETRTFCVDPIAPWNDYWATSGAVREPGIWARATCGLFTTPTNAQAREAVPQGAPWSGWATYATRKGGGTVLAASAGLAPGCHHAVLENNSGAGPNWPVVVCDSDDRLLIVDGGPIGPGAVILGFGREHRD